MKAIPVNRPLLDGNEQRYVSKCLEDGWISSEGPFVAEFEERFAARVGRRYGVAVSSGSAALEVGLAALDLGAGDEVIIPTFTIISCASPIIRAGATPVLVDSDPDTWNMDVSQVEERITPRTKAIMAVHTYGLPTAMDALLELAERYGIALIEDAAEVHGQSYRGRPCGSFGDLSIFSFYPNKLVTTGEGGMVVTDNELVAQSCRRFRNLCFQPDERRFTHDGLGWNYRMTNLQAAIGVAQLERLDEFVARKRRMGDMYTDLLNTLRGVQLPLARTEYAESIYWVYGLVLDESFGMDASEAMERLAQLQIGTRPFFLPMHQQPVFRRMGLFADQHFPVAERLGVRGFYIPSGVGLRDDEITAVAEAIHQLAD